MLNKPFESCQKFNLYPSRLVSALLTLIALTVTHRFLPKNLKHIAYARSKLSNSDIHEKIKGYLKGDDKTKQDFLDRITYVQGQYDGDEGFQVDDVSYRKLQVIFISVLLVEGVQSC